ncbi:aminopeptidase [Escherichia coli]|nr:aminopeptidase [Escherichia coli]
MYEKKILCYIISDFTPLIILPTPGHCIIANAPTRQS